MSCISCDESMSVNVLSLDAQHRHLMQLLSEYEAALSSCASQEKIYEILSRLLEYTYAHFSFEEKLLCYACYPAARQHCCDHEILKNKIAELLKEIEDGKEGKEIEILTLLVKWLNNHILKKDKAYSYHLAENGIL